MVEQTDRGVQFGGSVRYDVMTVMDQMETAMGEKKSTYGLDPDQRSPDCFPDCFSRAACFLAKLPPQVLGVSLGVGGLGILWRDITTIYEYDDTWNSPTNWFGFASHAFAYLCHSIVAISLVAYATKAAVHWNIFLAELWSSPKCATLATGPMALATVCTSTMRVFPLIACILWFVALTLHLVCGVFYIRSVLEKCRGEAQLEPKESGQVMRTISDWTSSRQSNGSRPEEAMPESQNSGQIIRTTSDWTSSRQSNTSLPGKLPTTQDGSAWTPAAFPPTVGIAALASCSTGIETREIAAFSFVVGVCWAMPVLVMVLVHAVGAKGLEVSQARTAIICAPFALCTAALWCVRNAYAKEEAESEVVSAFVHSLFQFLYVMSIVLYLVFLAYAPLLWSHRAVRAPGSAAFTFPTVIFATAMVRSHEFDPLLGKAGTQILAYAASAIATVVVLCVVFQFAVLLRGLWRDAASGGGIAGPPGSNDTSTPTEQAAVIGTTIIVAEVRQEVVGNAA
ncbi:unnamed protein product [Prorocentrum cordatum]|uniref:Uncharacterized protein n=1 Tax=Prorocentrum cordatum TaxID=2364126 RepID=A0ABN9VKI5_9DINO|nr:unnamed protein product [Polarella glacialis]